jgi:hypothetical protein
MLLCEPYSIKRGLAKQIGFLYRAMFSITIGKYRPNLLKGTGLPVE